MKLGRTLAISVALLTLGGCELAFPRQSQRTGGAGGFGMSGAGGAAGSGGSAGDAATGGTANGGYAGQENCLDGKDNDNNNYVDCADPACSKAGYTCQTSPPSGWQGYFRTAGDAFNTTSAPPTCPDGSQPATYKSSPSPPTCTPCTCGALSGACDPARIDCAQNANCSGATDWSSQFQSCTQVGHPSSLSCKLEPATLSAGASCPPSGGELTAPSTFTRWLYACGGANRAGGGCASGQSCAAPATGPYSDSVCISKAGEQTCPAGWNTRLVGYVGATDTRGCTACTCTLPAASAVCTGGAYTFYDHSICGCGLFVTCSSNKVVDSTNCVDVSSLLDPSPTDTSGDWGGNYTQAPKLVNASCTPSGGQPTGSIQTTGAVTFCCR